MINLFNKKIDFKGFKYNNICDAIQSILARITKEGYNPFDDTCDRSLHLSKVLLTGFINIKFFNDRKFLIIDLNYTKEYNKCILSVNLEIKLHNILKKGCVFTLFIDFRDKLSLNNDKNNTYRIEYFPKLNDYNIKNISIEKYVCFIFESMELFSKICYSGFDIFYHFNRENIESTYLYYNQWIQKIKDIRLNSYNEYIDDNFKNYLLKNLNGDYENYFKF